MQNINRANNCQQFSFRRPSPKRGDVLTRIDEKTGAIQTRQLELPILKLHRNHPSQQKPIVPYETFEECTALRHSARRSMKREPGSLVWKQMKMTIYNYARHEQRMERDQAAAQDRRNRGLATIAK